MSRASSERLPREHFRGVPLSMSRIRPEPLDAQPDVLLAASEIRFRQDDDDDEEEDDEKRDRDDGEDWDEEDEEDSGYSV